VTRIATGVSGLDLILGGGLEPGAVVVVAGAPGTGKTILAQQVCFAIGTTAHKGVFYTTVSEPDTKLVRHLEQFSFFDKGSLGSRVEHIHLGDILRPKRPEGLGPLVSEIVRKTLDEEPSVVVVDSAKMLRDFADERELRSALYDLTGRFAETPTCSCWWASTPPRSWAAVSSSPWPTASSSWSTRPGSRSTGGRCASSRCAAEAARRAVTPSRSTPTASGSSPG
jgi:circadian clock protein KaiC